MNSLFRKIGVLLALGLMSYQSSVLDASCDSPRRGPPGPPGSVSSFYASVYGNGIQIAVTSPYAIQFDQNQVPPVGIVHPVGLNLAQFQVQNTGIYLISWTFTAFEGLEDNLGVYLFNVSTNSLISPVPFSAQSLPPPSDSFAFNETISGQTVLPLTAGTVIQLQTDFSVGPLQIQNPSFSIVQIAL